MALCPIGNSLEFPGIPWKQKSMEILGRVEFHGIPWNLQVLLSYGLQIWWVEFHGIPWNFLDSTGIHR